MASGSFSVDVAAIRARQKMAEGPVTESYGRNPDEVVAVLNDVLATEIVCWMRYTRHAISAAGIDRAQVAAEFTEHADQEREHAMRAAERISQLGGDRTSTRRRWSSARTRRTRPSPTRTSKA
jgi:bacterioferritin